MKTINLRTLCLLLSIMSPLSMAHGQANIPKSLPERNPFLPTYIENDSDSRQTELSISAKSATYQPPKNKIYKYKLNYVQAIDIKDTLQSLCQTGKVSCEPLSNTIFFNGPVDEYEQLKNAIKNIDVPAKQITLEAKIISVNRENSKNLGINWSWDPIPQYINDSDNTSAESSKNQGKLKFWHGYSFTFGAQLNALYSEGKAKILATPRIITTPGKKASIFIGDHIPVQTEKHNSSNSYTSTEYIDAGIKLEYLPFLNESGTMVTAAVHTEVSTPTLIAELKNYKVTSRMVDTYVQMKNGETLLIGGLISDEEQKAWQKLPLLGDIPILGNLFKNRTHTKNKTEVILILTPYITNAGESPAIFQNEYTNLVQSFPKKGN